jgi:hypothetical protein
MWEGNAQGCVHSSTQRVRCHFHLNLPTHLSTSLARKHRYELRLDDEILGANKHFPKIPCLTEAWDKLQAAEVIDKNTETDYARWLGRRKEGTLPSAFQQEWCQIRTWMLPCRMYRQRCGREH